MSLEWGEFNDAESSVIQTPINPNMPNATVDALFDTTRRARLTDALTGFGPWKAVCLRIENPYDPDVGAYIASHAVTETGGLAVTELENRLKIKAWIPELHAHLPIPTNLPPVTVKDRNHKVIDMYPTFISNQNCYRTPLAGEVVWVDFTNREKRTGPIFIGVISSGHTQLVGFPDAPSSKSKFSQGSAGTIGGGPTK